MQALPPRRPGSPGIILFDEQDHGRQYGSSFNEDPLTPLDSIASPAIYYQQPTQYGDRKMSKPGSPSSRFIRNPDQDTPVMYPDDESGSRFAFLRRTNPQIVIAVIAGVGLGVILSHLEASADISKLVNLPGEVFLRLLKCFVIPMVFCSLSTGVANIVLLGKVSAVGTRTSLLFLCFSGAAATLSLVVSMALRPLHAHDQFEPPAKQRAFIHVQCADGYYMEQSSDAKLRCAATSMSNRTEFEILDLNGVILDNAVTRVTITDQVTRIFQSVFPDNIFKSFESGVLLSVIMFAIAFGAAAMRVSSEHSSPLLELLNQMNKIFFFVIAKLIDWSPLAVLSLIAGSLSSQKSLSEAVNHVGVLVLSNMITVAIFELVFYPIVLWVTTRRNPFKYMRQMLPCVYFAFGSASSVATLPITLRCAESTHEISRSLLRFVLTIGCSVHMNGEAMQFPNAMVFLATTSMSEIELGWVQMVLIVLVSLLSSIGVAPIPNGGLVMIYSIWATIFPNEEMPASYSFLVAIYWYLDRVNTACNVVGNTYVARIVAEQVDETCELTHNQQ